MTVDKLLITQLVNYINSNLETIDLPLYVTFGTPKTVVGEALWIQITGGTVVTKQYLRGSYAGELSFAMYFRLSSVVMNGIEAVMLIPHENLADFFSENLPEFDGFTIRSIDMTNQPTLFSRSEDGELTYQSIWRMRYKKE